MKPTKSQVDHTVSCIVGTTVASTSPLQGVDSGLWMPEENPLLSHDPSNSMRNADWDDVGRDLDAGEQCLMQGLPRETCPRIGWWELIRFSCTRVDMVRRGHRPMIIARRSFLAFHTYRIRVQFSARARNDSTTSIIIVQKLLKGPLRRAM